MIKHECKNVQQEDTSDSLHHFGESKTRYSKGSLLSTSSPQQQPFDFFRSDSVSQSSLVVVDDPAPPTMSSSICGILTFLAMYKNASSTLMPSLADASKHGISTLDPVTVLCS